MGVNMMILVLTTLAIAAFPSSSLPQLSPTDKQPLPDKKTNVAETSVDAKDGDDVEKNFADYIRLCNTLGIRPVSVGPSYTTSPYYTNNGVTQGDPQTMPILAMVETLAMVVTLAIVTLAIVVTLAILARVILPTTPTLLTMVGVFTIEGIMLQEEVERLSPPKSLLMKMLRKNIRSI